MAANPRSPDMNDQSPAEIIFFAALEKATPGERAAYLDEACAGNEALRFRAEALLAAHARVGQFLERPVVEAANVAALAPPDTGGNPAESGSSEAHTKTAFDLVSLDFLAPSQRPGSRGRLGH